MPGINVAKVMHFKTKAYLCGHSIWQKPNFYKDLSNYKSMLILIHYTTRVMGQVDMAFKVHGLQ